jgi:protein-tyrosine phosphatase
MSVWVELKRLGQMLARQGPVGTFWAGVDKAWRWRHGRPMMRFAQIDPALWLGGQPSDAGLRWLAERGVTAVVNLRSEHDYAALAEGVRVPESDARLRYLHLPIDDNTAPPLRLLEAGVDLIREARAAGGRAYVHCWEGLGRGPTLAAAFFVSDGLGPVEAWQRVRRVRPFVRPTEGQLEAVRRFAQDYTPQEKLDDVPVESGGRVPPEG